MPQAIESGNGEGYLLVVDEEGSARGRTKPTAGDATSSRPTVGVTSAQLVAARDSRQFLLLQNQGANPVYLSFGTTAATAQDWMVPAGGEFKSDRFPYAGPIQAIAVGGNSAVLVIEVN
jgi:hypothetical protein